MPIDRILAALALPAVVAAMLAFHRLKLASIEPPPAVELRCTMVDGRRRLDALARGKRFTRDIGPRSDWIDLDALLALLNRALRVAGATGKLTKVELTDDQGAHVLYATEDERVRLRRAELAR